MPLVEASSKVVHNCVADEGMHGQHGLVQAVRDKNFVNGYEGNKGSMNAQIYKIINYEHKRVEKKNLFSECAYNS